MMDSAELAASDPRVRAILTESGAYFSAALRRAWPQAGAGLHAMAGSLGKRRTEVAPVLPMLKSELGKLEFLSEGSSGCVHP